MIEITNKIDVIDKTLDKEAQIDVPYDMSFHFTMDRMGFK